MKDFLTAVALALVIEGISYAAFPEAMQRLMSMAAAAPPRVLRLAGLAAATAGVALVWGVRAAMVAP
ncbi:MAG: DUF2065 domain-containing protein [Actinomycetota bacterium]